MQHTTQFVPTDDLPTPISTNPDDVIGSRD